MVFEWHCTGNLFPSVPGGAPQPDGQPLQRGDHPRRRPDGSGRLYGDHGFFTASGGSCCRYGIVYFHFTPVQYVHNIYLFLHCSYMSLSWESSVADPDPNSDLEPYVFDSPGSGSISQRYGSGSGSFYHQAKIVRKPWFLLFSDFLLTFYLWKMMDLQKVISRKTFLN